MRLTIASALVFLVVGSAAAQNATPPGGGQPSAAGAGNMIRLRMQAVAAQPDTPGIGPYPALKEMAPNGLDFTIYRPRDLSALGGRKLGVHVWGNGGCSFDGGFARFHLMDIASYGYVSLAHGRLQDGPGGLPAPGAPRAPAEGMLAALNWILAENSRQGSLYYQRIDASKIAVSGNSCGGLLAHRVGQDPPGRVANAASGGTGRGGGDTKTWLGPPTFRRQSSRLPIPAVRRGTVSGGASGGVYYWRQQRLSRLEGFRD